MSITKIDNHVEQGLARLTSAYSQAERARALLAVFVGGVQDIEDALDEVVKGQLGKGGILSGAALDVLGRVVGLKRMGIDNETYAALLLGQIGQNASDGSTASVLAVAAQMFQATAVFIADPNAPVRSRSRACATTQLGIGSPKLSPALYPLAIKAIGKTLASGVSLSNATTFNAAGAFAFAGPQPWVRGFAALDGTGGGPMAQLIYSDPKETP
jgi:hypothetical protein